MVQHARILAVLREGDAVPPAFLESAVTLDLGEIDADVAKAARSIAGAVLEAGKDKRA